mmetsp:Transcript_36232/g.87734  ORF Transcript_36232/g.87734 Transcript_36232/m.87734 type:complete len:333 (+) Transcript_36232:131-1129(+)|eukprot:CAMPEP_0113654606 /NCGR_PEP_ID=MMETSP0017_2-20120614/29246_1 /TAXON_ID=2856 /ORGANISM="Cylindrotheca closterium" /LENGTH=332 /DNA_ID=CAMNT_0000567765 /DNA_START=65 /DNA_END=1063 /DNA_ORIENTATION=- /assembly_acc=CAM_ASM_000147
MSKSADHAVGLMDQAYFVGRAELLDFFNNLLGLNLQKIEQTATGAVACQLTEYIFPGSIAMSRVNWDARSDYEFIANYKLLQNAFTKNNIQRHVDVNKLIRAKYQDNLEFCQWMKAFFDQTGAHREDYDGKAVRARGKGGKKYDQQQANAGPARGTRAGSRGRAGRVTAPSRPTTTTTRAVNRSASPQKKAPLRENNRVMSKNTSPDPELIKKNKDLEAKNKDLETKNTEMEAKILDVETAMAELEKERDFYFGKLRNVELMLQVQQDKNFDGADLDTVVEKIFKVLYATAEEDVDIDDEGDIVPVADAEDPVNTTTASEPTSVAALEDEVF